CSFQHMTADGRVEVTEDTRAEGRSWPNENDCDSFEHQSITGGVMPLSPAQQYSIQSKHLHDIRE
ncbi:MAG TPA: hypothetical protein VKD23_17640, partial [Terriglobales bacterium]|nr:hypothetical protein [Terriglobales bacterium]